MRSVMKDQPKAGKKIAPVLAHKAANTTKNYQPPTDKKGGKVAPARARHIERGSRPDQMSQKNENAKGAPKAQPHKKLLNDYGKEPKVVSKESIKTGATPPTEKQQTLKDYKKFHPAMQGYGGSSRSSCKGSGVC
jgi:hypothetical protein